MPAPPATASASLAIDSRPESLTVVRALLAGIAEAVGIDGERFDDLRTAVSEACNNVVIHAYGGEPGPMWVELELRTGVLGVRVLDRGGGVRRIDSAAGRMRVGLALISALATHAEVSTRPGGGTEVGMQFGEIGAPSAGIAAVRSEPPSCSEPIEADDAVVYLEPASLLEGVLGRVCAAVATAVHFSVDRHADLQLVADELAALSRADPPLPSIGFSVGARQRRLELKLGPLPTGTWSESQARAARHDLDLGRLADGLDAVPLSDAELLRVTVTQRRLGSGPSGGELAQPGE